MDSISATDFKFVIEREFAIEQARMFELWTDCKHLLQWFTPRGNSMLHCSNDFRVGGLMHYQLRAGNGMEYWGRWVYREIAPPERLEFIVSFSDESGGVTVNPWQAEWPREMLSEVDFEDRDGKTLVRVTWTAHDASAEGREAFKAGADSMRAGWGGTLDNLEEYVGKV